MESRGWKMIRGGSCNTHRSVSRRAHFPRDLLVLGGHEARARARLLSPRAFDGKRNPWDSPWSTERREGCFFFFGRIQVTGIS
jgi:hypothetical protein